MNRSESFFRDLPKVDLHRHLEGSLRLSTLIEIAQTRSMDLPAAGELRERVQIGAADPFTFQNFLSKFQTLRLFYQSPELITRLVEEAVADAAADQIRLLELRFTPAALARVRGFSLADVMDWVIEGAHNASQAHPIQVGLIASVNRHESLDLAGEVVRQAEQRIERGIVGIDLAGDEANFPGAPFAGLFQEARQAGLHVTVHAGEWNGAANVVEAITVLGADRIGHGVRVLEDPGAVRLARERGVLFETCITSNYQSGAIPSGSAHPITPMLAHGLDITINSDDPSISQIRLSGEYRRACQECGLSLHQLRERILAAARGSFLEESKRQRCVQSLAQELDLF